MLGKLPIRAIFCEMLNLWTIYFQNIALSFFLVLIQCHRKDSAHDPLVLSGKKGKRSNFPCNEMEE